MKPYAGLRVAFSLLIAIAIPVFATWVNGGLKVEFVMLGLVLGFACWYWGPWNVGL